MLIIKCLQEQPTIVKTKNFEVAAFSIEDLLTGKQMLRNGIKSFQWNPISHHNTLQDGREEIVKNDLAPKLVATITFCNLDSS